METMEALKEALLERLLKHTEWNLTEDAVRFYQKGFEAGENKEEQELVRSTNIKYHKTESNALMGNYLVIWQNGALRSVCRFSMDYLFALYQKDGWEPVWENIWQNLELSRHTDEAGVLEKMHDYEAVKEHLIIRPLNFTDNRYELKECVYQQVGDIALVLYVRISDDDVHGLTTAKVPKKIFEEWGQQMDAVWENALLNTYVAAQPRMYMTPQETVNPPYGRGAFMALGSSINKIWHSQVPVITTTKQTNGAIALFYPGVKERIAKMAGGSYYVVFTSIHDARVHCEGSTTPRQILRGLKDVNKMFDASEILSRKVYFYDAQKETFEAMEL